MESLPFKKAIRHCGSNLSGMWDQLKKRFFGPKGPLPKIQPLVFQDGLLAFRASEQLKMGAHKVLAPGAEGEIQISIEVLSFDEEEHTYRGKVADEVFSLDAMRLERRGEFRLTQAIRVTSSELPGYEGRTEDISLSGTRLTVRGELEPGRYLGLTLHFADPTVPDLDVRGEVRWCAPFKGGNLFHCGVRFSSLEKADRLQIKRFIHNRVAMGAKI